MQEENNYPSTGYLIIHVTTARGAIPLEGATVTVRNYLPEFDSSRGDVIETLITDRSGNTPRLTLPAPPRAASQSPGEIPTFSTYNLEVQLEGYNSQQYIALPIFADVTAIQPVDMIPLPENGTSDPYRPTEDRFYETTAPNL